MPLLTLLLALTPMATATVCDTLSEGDLACDGTEFDGRAWAYDVNYFNTYSCINHDQAAGETFYTFVCPDSGTVVFEMSNPICDLDFFLLGDDCNANTCLDRNIDTPVPGADNVFRITHDCITGEVLHLVVEAFGPWYDWSLGNPDCGIAAHPRGPFGLSAYSDFRIRAVCDEDCGDGADNDFDGFTDCLDSDCDCVEDCSTPGDEDLNGVADCADSACYGTAACCDVDGDGVDADTPACGFGGDCDDNNRFQHPGRTEIVADGLDQDCDGVDSCYADLDLDGFGSTDVIVGSNLDCNLAGESDNDLDCRDVGSGAGNIYPQADEIPGDDIDQDCDDVDTCFRDADSDGYGTDQLVDGDDLTCADSPGRASVGGDCLDDGANAAVTNPGAEERCNGRDDDCDDTIDDADDSLTGAPSHYLDADGDGAGDPNTAIDACIAPPRYVSNSADCNDLRSDVNPQADEVCNERDDDCDGLVDADDQLADSLPAYVDDDGDGFGNASLSVDLNDCSLPDGFAFDAGDCDDDDETVSPDGLEIPYDGLDQDCSGGDLTDVDGDGAQGGPLGSDCDDRDPTRFPGAPELPDGIDQDCDGTVDQGTTAYDDDGDGYAELGGDCDDDDAAVNPAAAEIPNSMDDDCNGLVDDRTDAYDDDGDGFSEDQGDCSDADPTRYPGASVVPGSGIASDCGAVPDGDLDGDGYSPDGGDCDDTDALIFPHAPERSNQLDDDCDGTVDEGTDRYDDDGDGVTERGGDCNDGNETISPAAVERPTNRVDDDCDGVVDEGGIFVDDDGDGFSEDGGDCDDSNPLISPAAAENANGLDDDCDGQIDEDSTDLDRDGYTAANGDCDDEVGWANPGAEEVCDGIDNDCNDTVDEGCFELEADPNTDPVDDTGCSHGLGWPAWLTFLVLPLMRRRS